MEKVGRMQRVVHGVLYIHCVEVGGGKDQGPATQVIHLRLNQPFSFCSDMRGVLCMGYYSWGVIHKCLAMSKGFLSTHSSEIVDEYVIILIPLNVC